MLSSIHCQLFILFGQRPSLIYPRRFFTIRYINNSLPTRKNMARWRLSQSPDCSFFLNPKSLLRIVAGPQQYLDRFVWRHDSILNFIARSLQPAIDVHSSLYADVNGFLNPSIITGGNYRPDFLFLFQSKCLYVLELTVGFESNLNNNAVYKQRKIREFDQGNKQKITDEMRLRFDWDFLRRMLHVRYIAIRAKYYIFCCRNKNWDSADLMKLRFWIIQSQATNRALPILNEVYNCTLKKTNKVSLVISGAALALASAVPKLRKSIHHRKFGNHVTVHWPPTACRPSVRTKGKSMFYLTSSELLAAWVQPCIAHPCCDQLTAVKTEFPLTSIRWPYGGLSIDPSRWSIFMKLSADKLPVFRWSPAQVLFFWNA